MNKNIELLHEWSSEFSIESKQISRIIIHTRMWTDGMVSYLEMSTLGCSQIHQKGLFPSVEYRLRAEIEDCVIEPGSTEISTHFLKIIQAIVARQQEMWPSQTLCFKEPETFFHFRYFLLWPTAPVDLENINAVVLLDLVPLLPNEYSSSAARTGFQMAKTILDKKIDPWKINRLDMEKGSSIPMGDRRVSFSVVMYNHRPWRFDVHLWEKIRAWIFFNSRHWHDQLPMLPKEGTELNLQYLPLAPNEFMKGVDPLHDFEEYLLIYNQLIHCGFWHPDLGINTTPFQGLETETWDFTPLD